MPAAVFLHGFIENAHRDTVRRGPGLYMAGTRGDANHTEMSPREGSRGLCAYG